MTHNVRLPDKDTGLPRQRDVWIETKYGGHLPIKILVSCKREAAKLSQQEMDAFIGELRSSGAHVGVLYSYSGYTEPALAKALAAGICCCSLNENKPPDVPEVLTFTALCFTECCRLSMQGSLDAGGATISEVFDLPVAENAERTVLQALIERHDASRRKMLSTIGSGVTYPSNWRSAIEVFFDGSLNPLAIELEGRWKVYQAKTESWLVNGSYSFANKDFKGSVSTRTVDRLGSHPGPGWELQLDAVPIRQNVVSFLL